MDGMWIIAAAAAALGTGLAVGLALKRLGEERARLEAELAAERRATVERAREVERTREAVRAEVEKLAGRVLDEKGKLLVDRSEAGLRALLGPVREKLQAFEERIERTYHEESR